MSRSAFDALRPDADDKKDGSVRQAQSLKAQREKRVKEDAAKERKRKRDLEKERVAKVAESVAKDKEDEKKMMKEANTTDRERIILAYLSNPPPFYGESDRSDKDEVRKRCMGLNDPRPNDKHFDWDRKMWGTRKLQNIPSLIEDDGYGGTFWWPDGISKEWEGDFRRILNEKLSDISASAEAKSDAAREESMIGREPVRTEAEKRAFEIARNEQAGILDTTDAEREKMAKYGIDDRIVAKSRTWGDLGLTVDTSLEGRILRFLRIFKLHIRWEFQGKDFNDKSKYKPAQKDALSRLVEEWRCAEEEGSNWKYKYWSIEDYMK